MRWNEVERAGGVYWGGTLPETFMSYATPDLPDAGVRTNAVIDPR